MVCRSTAFTCCISPSWSSEGWVVVSGCTPLASTIVGTSTTASAGSPASVVPLRTFKIIVARSFRVMAAITPRATPA